jgi:hypothetical protein
MTSKKITVFIALLFVLLVAACSPATAGTGTDVPQDLPAVQEAQNFLSESLGVDVTQVQVVKVEDMEWPDACLGLPSGDEACAQVITPGFRITLEVNGQTYILHTDESGLNIRQQQ